MDLGERVVWRTALVSCFRPAIKLASGACLLGLLALAGPAQADEAAPDCVLESMTCQKGLEGFFVELRVAVPAGQEATIEVVDLLGNRHRRTLTGGMRALSFTLPAEAVEASLDPDQVLPDPDRYNNHVPRRLVVTPWPEAPRDAYLLRYFPGLTFKQGQAPVRPRGAPMMPPVQGPIGLGVGLEGRRLGEHGWQVLANLGSSPFAPSLDPRFSLHGYYLPHPNWGLDGDVGLDLRGTLTSEFGTSLIMWGGGGPAGASPVLAHQLRFAIGRQAPAATGLDGYHYGALTLFRDDTATLGWSSNVSLFGGLDGAWRATLDGQTLTALTERLHLRLGTSAGWSDGPLSLPNRLGAGLVSHDWQTAQGRLGGRVSLLTPLAQGLALPLGPVAVLDQIEGSVFAEGATLYRPDAPDRGPVLAGVGAEVVLVQDTVIGIPLSLNLGYAMPIYDGRGFTSPFPGRFYITTTDAFFPRVVKTSEGP